MRSRILTLVMPAKAFHPLLKDALKNGDTWADATMMRNSHHWHQGQIRYMVSALAAERIVRQLPITDKTALGLAYLARGVIEHLNRAKPAVAVAWVPRPLDEEPPVEEPAPVDENEEHRLRPGDVLDPGYGGER